MNKRPVNTLPPTPRLPTSIRLGLLQEPRMVRTLLSTPLALLLAWAMLLSCNEQSQARSDAGVNTGSSDTAAAPAPKTKENEPAAGKPGSSTKFSYGFSKTNAWAHMNKILSFGPRVANTKGHRACRAYIQRELQEVCDDVQVQEFSVPQQPKKLEMVNIIGRIGLDKQRRILIISHWDTRPWADQEADLGLHKKPIPGANDGASGNAIMLELARVFGEKHPDVGVDLLFTDGEDYGPGLEMMFLGAEYFAKGLSDSQVKSYNYAVLLDMVGDASLDIHPETRSEAVAPLIYSAAMEINKALGFNDFKAQGAYEIYDDHLALIDRGMKIYDFIDFNYKQWHTLDDTIEHCHPDSLESVGRTVENMVYLFPAIYGTVE